MEKEWSEEQGRYVANVIQNERRSNVTATSANSRRDRLMFEEQTCSRDMILELKRATPGTEMVSCKLHVDPSGAISMLNLLPGLISHRANRYLVFQSNQCCSRP